MNKKHIAFNTQINFFLAAFFMFLGITISGAVEGKLAGSIFFGFFTLLPVLAFAFSPLYFVFSDEDVVIVYNFGFKEQIKWSEIRNISLTGSWILSVGGLPHYVIAYPQKGKRPFFIVGEISKSAKTTKLIKKYYNKKIV